MLLGALMVVVGAGATLGLVYALNIRRTRTLSQNTEDIHGSARWATPDDVRATGLLDNPQGVYIGGWYEDTLRRLHYLRHNGPEHILVFAPTRSGKGVGLVIPTLLAWSESCVVYDIKGENWAKSAGYRSKSGHLCFKFSPVEAGNGSRFNPLAEIRIGTPRDVSDAQNAAEIIARISEEAPRDPYWEDTAVSITAGMILHVCYAAAASGRVACLADLAEVYTQAGQTFQETLAELENFPHDPEHKYQWRTPDGERTATHPTVRKKVREMMAKMDRDFSGVLSSITTSLALYCDPLVAHNTATSDFTIDDLVNHSCPVSLYLVVPNSDRDRLRPLIQLIFTIIVNRLTERLDFEGAAQKHNRHRLMFMIDEFPSLKRMPIFASALSYMGGYGLKAYLITQDIRQIVEEYGPNESIVSNCHVRVAYAPNQYDTAELLSKMTGSKTVQKATFNFSGPRISPILNHMNASVEQIERPLMTPDEVMRLKPPVKRGQGDNERIVAPGDMLIFVSGEYPIYGKQALYFFDPEFSKRAVEAPPQVFYAIEEGKVRRQPPLEHPADALSRPELLPAENSGADGTNGGVFADDPFSFDADHTGAPMTASRGFLEQLDMDRQVKPPKLSSTHRKEL
jgi:type IV secretion system protein VirD4